MLACAGNLASKIASVICVQELVLLAPTANFYLRAITQATGLKVGPQAYLESRSVGQKKFVKLSVNDRSP